MSTLVSLGKAWFYPEHCESPVICGQVMKMDQKIYLTVIKAISAQKKSTPLLYLRNSTGGAGHLITGCHHDNAGESKMPGHRGFK